MPKAGCIYPLAIIMSKAWGVAHQGARRFGGKPREYLAEALRMCWARAKRAAAEVAAMGGAAPGRDRAPTGHGPA